MLISATHAHVSCQPKCMASIPAVLSVQQCKLLTQCHNQNFVLWLLVLGLRTRSSDRGQPHERRVSSANLQQAGLLYTSTYVTIGSLTSSQTHTHTHSCSSHSLFLCGAATEAFRPPAQQREPWLAVFPRLQPQQPPTFVSPPCTLGAHAAS